MHSIQILCVFGEANQLSSVSKSLHKELMGHIRRLGVQQNEDYSYYMDLLEPFAHEVIDKTIAICQRLSTIPSDIDLPQGSAQLNEFALRVARQLSGMTEAPLNFFVGSCPDYSYDLEKLQYTHQDLGEHVPLLSQVHLQAFEPVARLLDEEKIAFTYTIMVADVEAYDEVFAQRFTQGNQDEFLERCRNSSLMTAHLLHQKYADERYQASTFLEEFGEQNFLDRQRFYEKRLGREYYEDDSFSQRIQKEIKLRTGLYTQMYPEQYQAFNDKEMDTFLVERTIRTMAQYIVLSEQIRKREGLVINHQTVNSGIFNEQALLEESGQKPLPVFVLQKKVY